MRIIAQHKQIQLPWKVYVNGPQFRPVDYRHKLFGYCPVTTLWCRTRRPKKRTVQYCYKSLVHFDTLGFGRKILMYSRFKVQGFKTVYCALLLYCYYYCAILSQHNGAVQEDKIMKTTVQYCYNSLVHFWYIAP